MVHNNSIQAFSLQCLNHAVHFNSFNSFDCSNDWFDDTCTNLWAACAVWYSSWEGSTADTSCDSWTDSCGSWSQAGAAVPAVTSSQWPGGDPGSWPAAVPRHRQSGWASHWSLEAPYWSLEAFWLADKWRPLIGWARLDCDLLRQGAALGRRGQALTRPTPPHPAWRQPHNCRERKLGF